MSARETGLAARLAEVSGRIERAARDAGRDPAGVTLVAVSKTFGAEAVEEALAAGVTDLGENRAQELRDKARAVTGSARWHFVGHLQTNKVRHVVGVCRLIHSLDGPELADAIARRARREGVVQEALIEVNVSGEDSKEGVAPGDAGPLLDEVAGLDGLRVTGLMTVPPWPEDPEESRPHYRALAELAGGLGLGELSMGMTRDFEVAISEGATLVRVGEAIFGPRRGSSAFTGPTA